MYFRCSDGWLVYRDSSQFINHALPPNSQIVYPESNDYRDLKAYALRDIKAGEEIVEDYSNYLSLGCKWVIPLLEKYNPPRLEFELSLAKREKTSQ